jgi:serine/threonine-protein kinase
MGPRGESVAIKCLHPVWIGDPQQRKRLLREALIVNTIDHPGVVPIIDHGEVENAGPFLVMELLTGTTLRARFDKLDGPLPWLEVVHIAECVLDVLIAAHDKGIVHCDVKPSNIFLCDDRRVKLLDFGIARPPALMLDTTLSVNVAGTPACMAPEQVLDPGKIDARTDLWSLGATMFRAITGEWPRLLPEPIGSLLDAARRPARPIAALLPQLPAEVRRAIDTALQDEPSERWQSAADMLRCLRAASSDTHAIGSTPAPQSDTVGDLVES